MFCDLFRQHGVEFIIIGGQAESLHGSPRATYDWDFCYRRTAQNLVQLAAALRELAPTLRNAPPDLPFIIDDKTLALGDTFTFDTKWGPLDLLGHVEPIGDYDDLMKNAEYYEVDGNQLPVIGLDDLLRVKEHIARAKDSESVFQLRAIKQARESADG